ncbi:MAG: 50S ribosomal protein L22, partial [Eubacterium sp.]
MSPIKLKPVTDLVRGKDLNEALNILRFTPGKGSEIVEKVVESAAANAENNFDMNPDNLYVAEISANQGPTTRFFAAGMRERQKRMLIQHV